VGVGKIVPVKTERTIKQNLNLVRLNKIAKEAAEQSGRYEVPVVEEPVSFKDALENLIEKELNLFFDFGDNITKISDLDINTDVSVFIGPEGGFTQAERTLAEKHNLTFTTLGSNVLRAETAAITSVWYLSLYKNII